MAVEILFPELGESVHEGQVSKWLKQVGDFVKEDEPIVEIMTDKVNTELPAPATGILVEITVPEGDDVEVFHKMGVIEEDEAKAKAMLAIGAPAQASTEAAAPVASATVVSDEPPVASTGDRKWFTPVVRAMARDNSISDMELAAVAGPGFRDTTRLASSNPSMSHDISLTNRKNLVHWLDRYMEELHGLRDIIDSSETQEELIERFATVQTARDAFMVAPPPKPVPEQPTDPMSAGERMMSFMVGEYVVRRTKEVQELMEKRASGELDDLKKR